jgi:hypothetical protein
MRTKLLENLRDYENPKMLNKIQCQEQEIDILRRELNQRRKEGQLTDAKWAEFQRIEYELFMTKKEFEEEKQQNLIN